MKQFIFFVLRYVFQGIYQNQHFKRNIDSGAHKIFSVLYFYLQFCRTTESFEMVSEKVFQVVCVYQQRIYPETIYQILQQCFIWTMQDPYLTWSVQQLYLSLYLSINNAVSNKFRWPIFMKFGMKIHCTTDDLRMCLFRFITFRQCTVLRDNIKVYDNRHLQQNK